MKITGTLAQNVLFFFKNDSSFSDITFVFAYENEDKPTPVTKVIAAVSVVGCEISDFIKEKDSLGATVITNKRNVDTTLSIDLYLPHAYGNLKAQRIFDRISTALIFGLADNIISAVCEEAQYDADSQAVVLRSSYVFRDTVTG